MSSLSINDVSYQRVAYQRVAYQLSANALQMVLLEVRSAVSGQRSAVSLFYSKAPIALRARCANSSVEQASTL
ncbi:MAG: hypothetical protein F6K63_04745 [Moorea sp. SIO1G6]|uniref:Uncharacterized protein n=1 Tax=Moorena producens (strain JHB) TaxID=1454205 RepID=A0A9Q9UVI5_MOOP1|nr:hypothetical protein [Moorena sp. SIO1G6]NET63740.1 hypothetical protein [Moorena sp. SIO1G6]WAN68871.1 hypothetical protein BJP36_41655 [Moorena producens JHB]